jgi:hypothetical protein
LNLLWCFRSVSSSSSEMINLDLACYMLTALFDDIADGPATDLDGPAVRIPNL